MTKYHVISKGNKWALLKEGNKRATIVLDNKEDVIDFGKSRLQKCDVLYAYDKDGSVYFSVIFWIFLEIVLSDVLYFRGFE